MAGFAAATALDGSDGDYVGAIEPGWDIVGNANGGYLMAMLARGAVLASGRPDVVSLSAEFLRPGRPGPVTVATEVVKAGRRFVTTRASLDDAGGPVITGTAITGDLRGAEGPSLLLADREIIPEPAACVRTEPGEVFPPPFAGRVDTRIHPEDVPFAGGSTAATVRGWFRLRDEEPMDTLAVVLASDAFPPTVFNTELGVGWVPTVQMTVHVRSRPSGPWLQMHMTTSYITSGMFEADAVIWDERGALVAQSRQLALTPRS